MKEKLRDTHPVHKLWKNILTLERGKAVPKILYIKMAFKTTMDKNDIIK